MSDLVIPPGYGRVVGRVLRAVTVETGPAPLVGARVTVRPSVARVTRDGDPTPLIMGDAIECTLDDNGFLLGPDGEQGVLLVATDADTRPAGWHWLVRVSAPSVASYQWQVLVPEGVTTDMVAATSDPAVSGLPLLEWRGILTEVWEAHADVMSAAGAVDHDRQSAMAARAGAEQAAGRAETASSQAVTAQGAAIAARGDAEAYASQAASSAQDAASLEASALAHKSAAASSAQAAEGGAQDAEAAAAAAAGSAGSAFDDAAIAQGARLGAEAARDVAEAAADTAETAATVAVTAQGAAEGFAGDAETARDQAVTAAAALKDTGWRNIATSLDPETWSITTARLRRHGSLVTFTAQIKALKTNASYTPLLIIPWGFRLSQLYVYLNSVSATNTLATIRATALLSVEGAVAKDAILRIQSSWTTSDPFPTPAQYPGTPA